MLSFRPVIVAVALAVLLMGCTGQLATAFPFLDIPSQYELNADLNANVDSLRSPKAVTPFNYYRLPVCPPTQRRIQEERTALNPGQVLMGNRVLPSDYNFTVLQDAECVSLCGVVNWTRKETRRAAMFIYSDFRGQMYLDALPLVTRTRGGSDPMLGHPLGTIIKGTEGGATAVQLYNHLAFRIVYQVVKASSPEEKPHYTIVEFSAEAQSVGPNCDATNSESLKNLILPNDMARTDFFTTSYSYSVHWVRYEGNDDALTARSTAYQSILYSDPTTVRKGHWVTALNSTLIVLILSVVVLVVLVRTIRRDLAAYLDEGDTNFVQEHGWKLVRGDAFRAPFQAVLFVAVISSGVQAVSIVLLIVLAFVCGLLNSSKRGELLSGVIALFLLTSPIAGYTAARLLKFFHKQSWRNGIFAILFCPSILVCGYLMMNTINWAKHTSLAIPFSYAFGLASIWLFLSLPLGILGLVTGFKQDVLAVSARVSNIPRLIPVEASGGRQQWIWMCAGALPLMASMLEISYMLSAMWQGQLFYMMGTLALIVLNVFLICAEMGVIVTYSTLVRQDYRWWWPSFTSLASSGAFLFLYTLFYLVRYLEITSLSSIILYMGYMAGLASFFGVMCGTISTVASFMFVNLLYTVVKSD